NGQRILNMVHRDDVIGGIIAALERGRPGQIYNVSDDEPVTQIELFKWLSKKFGKPLPPAVDIRTGGARKRASTNKRVSNIRSKTDLGYSPKYSSFREGF